MGMYSDGLLFDCQCIRNIKRVDQAEVYPSSSFPKVDKSILST